MAIVGLKMAYVGQVDPVTQLLIPADKSVLKKDILAIDDTYFGSKTANITNLEGSITNVWGNNKKQDGIVGSAAPTVAWDVNNLFFDLAQELIGNTADGHGGFKHLSTKPHFAMLIESESIDRKNSIYFGFGNGFFTQPSQNIGTNTENQTREDDNLTYNALDTNAFDNYPYKTYYSGSEDFDIDTMYKEVFGGYTKPTDNGEGGAA